MTVTPEGTRRDTRPVDFVNVGSLLSEEERGVRDRVRAFVDEHVVPVAAGYWDRAEFPFDLLPGLGELGIMGGTIGEEAPHVHEVHGPRIPARPLGRDRHLAPPFSSAAPMRQA